ncbi:carboxypeptidase-like regulatory domain-containing protein [Aquimarina algiphila]|uniref:carboxypeptidase-like regulatory domain-containing protein n=1 Tax=Aquimarina algiphila TaxID=2047982 RepID=UPI00232F2BDA|nr:carboxypeptidase-like regulatory domain-containing protein [Aquimarina algiphila]
MKKLTLFLLLVPVYVFSQSVSGVVVDQKTKKPIQTVNVYLEKVKEGTITNEKGAFYLKLDSKVKKKDTLYFSHLGYKTKKLLFLEFKKKDTIYLVNDPEKLNEVTLISDKKLKPKIQFTKLTSLQRGLHSFGSLLIDNKIYIIGGDASFKTDIALKTFNNHPELTGPDAVLSDFLKKARTETGFSWENYKGELLIYDIALDTWKNSDLKFRKRAYHNLNYHNGKIYVLGGKYLSDNRKYEYLDNKIEVFDIKKNTISIDDTNPHQAIDFMSFTYRNHIIVMGGSIKARKDGTKIYTDKVHLYNLETGFWYELEDMPDTEKMKGILVNHKIYLIRKRMGKAFSEIKTFDLISGKWEDKGELPVGIDNAGIVYKNGIIYFFEEGKLYEYNINTKVLNEYLINLFLKGSKLHHADNKLYVLGGFEEDRLSKEPSSGVFSIDLGELTKTRIHRSKNL